MKPLLHSFDIFHTVLTRTFAVPGDLFVALGEEAGRRGLLQVVPEEFARKRMAAESAARRTTPAQEPGLSEVYAVLARELGLPPAETSRLLDLELELEEAALQPVPGMQERVAAARRLLPVECRYLYGSRQAWHLPSVDRVDDTILEWLFIGPRFLSVEQVLGRLGRAGAIRRGAARRGIAARLLATEPDCRSMLEPQRTDAEPQLGRRDCPPGGGGAGTGN